MCDILCPTDCETLAEAEEMCAAGGEIIVREHLAGLRGRQMVEPIVVLGTQRGCQVAVRGDSGKEAGAEGSNAHVDVWGRVYLSDSAGGAVSYLRLLRDGPAKALPKDATFALLIVTGNVTPPQKNQVCCAWLRAPLEMSPADTSP